MTSEAAPKENATGAGGAPTPQRSEMSPGAHVGRYGVRAPSSSCYLTRVTGAVEVRDATADDASFVVEMARMACTIEDRPLPPADSSEVASMLPGRDDCVGLPDSAHGD